MCAARRKGIRLPTRATIAASPSTTGSSRIRGGAGVPNTLSPRTLASAAPKTKPIAPPVTDYLGAPLPQTVQIYFNGVQQAYGSAWTLNATTGIVTCTPGNTVVVTASGQFHYPVRFDVDELPIRVQESDTADGQPIVSIDAAPLIEVLPPNY